MTYLALFFLAMIGPIFPVVNTEALVVLRTAHGGIPTFVVLAAAAGQTVLFVLLWAVGEKGLARFKPVARRLAAWSPERRLRFEKGATWPLIAGAVLGIPPFVALAPLAGTIRYPFPALVAISLVGRIIRFSVLVSAGAGIRHWMGA